MIAVASFSMAGYDNSEPCNDRDINATGRSFWFSVAETAMSLASHSTVNGIDSSIACRVADAMELFKL
jgi:hypothetical protein